LKNTPPKSVKYLNII